MVIVQVSLCKMGCQHHPALVILHCVMHTVYVQVLRMQINLHNSLILSYLALAASPRMPFSKLYAATPAPGLSPQGVALGASPRLIAADLPKTGAAQAGGSVTGSTQQHDKSVTPAKG